MTNEDQIKGHFSAMAECTGNLRRNFDPTRRVENDEVTLYLQKQLDAIRELLEPLSETNNEEIRWNLDQIARATGRKWGSGVQAQVKFVQGRLDAIRKLLEPKPETLAATVNRLTDICNTLGRENALLRNDLTDMTLNFNAAEKHARQLEKNLATTEVLLEVADKELTSYRKGWGRIDHLREQNRKLQTDIAKQNKYIKLLKDQRHMSHVANPR